MTAEEIALIRKLVVKSEKEKKLTDPLLKLIEDKQWFRIFVPTKYNGNVQPLTRVVALEEHLAHIDGSLGWTVTLCSGAGWFAGFLPESVATEFMGARNCCIAGSGAPTGTARRSGNGFIVNGTWKYATGAPHASSFTANCYILDEKGEPEAENGAPLVRAFIFRREEVLPMQNWNAIGMIASASHGFEIRDRYVDGERSFNIRPEAATSDHPVFQYPFLQLAEVTLAANISGMVRHFLDICQASFAAEALEKKFSHRQSERIRKDLETAEQEMETVRNSFYAAVFASWEYCENAKALPDELLSYVSRTSKLLASTGIQWVDTLYPYGGLGFADRDSEVNRVWRDIHTAGQHTLLLRDIEN